MVELDEPMSKDKKKKLDGDDVIKKKKKEPKKSKKDDEQEDAEEPPDEGKETKKTKVKKENLEAPSPSLEANKIVKPKKAKKVAASEVEGKDDKAAKKKKKDAENIQGSGPVDSEEPLKDEAQPKLKKKKSKKNLLTETSEHDNEEHEIALKDDAPAQPKLKKKKSKRNLMTETSDQDLEHKSDHRKKRKTKTKKQDTAESDDEGENKTKTKKSKKNIIADAENDGDLKAKTKKTMKATESSVEDVESVKKKKKKKTPENPERAEDTTDTANKDSSLPSAKTQDASTDEARAVPTSGDQIFLEESQSKIALQGANTKELASPVVESMPAEENQPSPFNEQSKLEEKTIECTALPKNEACNTEPSENTGKNLTVEDSKEQPSNHGAVEKPKEITQSTTRSEQPSSTEHLSTLEEVDNIITSAGLCEETTATLDLSKVPFDSDVPLTIPEKKEGENLAPTSAVREIDTAQNDVSVSGIQVETLSPILISEQEDSKQVVMESAFSPSTGDLSAKQESPSKADAALEITQVNRVANEEATPANEEATPILQLEEKSDQANLHGGTGEIEIVVDKINQDVEEKKPENEVKSVLTVVKNDEMTEKSPETQHLPGSEMAGTPIEAIQKDGTASEEALESTLASHLDEKSDQANLHEGNGEIEIAVNKVNQDVEEKKPENEEKSVLTAVKNDEIAKNAPQMPILAVSKENIFDSGSKHESSVTATNSSPPSEGKGVVPSVELSLTPIESPKELRSVCDAMTALVKSDDLSSMEMNRLKEQLMNLFGAMYKERSSLEARLHEKEAELSKSEEKIELLENEIEKQLADWDILEVKLGQADGEIRKLLAENQRLENELDHAAKRDSKGDPGDIAIVNDSLTKFSAEIAIAKSELEDAKKKMDLL